MHGKETRFIHSFIHPQTCHLSLSLSLISFYSTLSTLSFFLLFLFLRLLSLSTRKVLILTIPPLGIIDSSPAQTPSKPSSHSSLHDLMTNSYTYSLPRPFEYFPSVYIRHDGLAACLAYGRFPQIQRHHAHASQHLSPQHEQ